MKDELAELNHQEWQEQEHKLGGLPIEIKNPLRRHLEAMQGYRELDWLKSQRLAKGR